MALGEKGNQWHRAVDLLLQLRQKRLQEDAWALGPLSLGELVDGIVHSRALPSGKYTKNYGKSPLLMGKSTSTI